MLLIVFGGDTHALIPLYMLGVFVSFTLSQAGMVIHWRTLRSSGWRTSAAINGFGAIVTGIVLVIVAVTKAAEGAWIIILMIPVLVVIFVITRRHYDHVASELSLRNWAPEKVGRHVVMVPIGGIQRAVVKALRYARTLSADVRAVYVEINPTATDALRKQWPDWGQQVELVVLESPYRSLMEPLLEYIEEVQRADPDESVTVILPEFVPHRLWQHLLHNQHALLIKGALLFKPNVVVTSVPFHLGRSPRERERRKRLGTETSCRVNPQSARTSRRRCHSPSGSTRSRRSSLIDRTKRSAYALTYVDLIPSMRPSG